jgi:hypothetical protein
MPPDDAQKSLTTVHTCDGFPPPVACLLPDGDLLLDASNRPAVAGNPPPDVDPLACGAAPLANAGPLLVADLLVRVAANRLRPFPARILLAPEIRGIPTRAGNSWLGSDPSHTIYTAEKV